MNDKLLHQKRALQRLTLAQTAFRQARALCEHMEKLKLEPHEEIASAMMAGIVVSYVRPFVRNDGIGQLPKRYSEFEKRKQQYIETILFIQRTAWRKRTGHYQHVT